MVEEDRSLGYLEDVEEGRPPVVVSLPHGTKALKRTSSRSSCGMDGDGGSEGVQAGRTGEGTKALQRTGSWVFLRVGWR